MNSLLIYVNFPFCRQKCHFCDWVQRVPKTDLFLKAEDSARKNYVDALCKEIMSFKEFAQEKQYVPKVIYWGGGTATTMSKDEIDKIMSALKYTFDLSNVTEWTIEGSPDTVTLDSLEYYKSIGFNRFSMGIQSFNDDRLRHLGRRHDRASTIESVYAAQNAGFDKVSIDLMCGFADETEGEIEKNVQEVCDLNLKQLSLYTFRPTEGTMLRRQHDKNAKLLNPGKQVNAYLYGSQLLRSAGFNEYGVGYFGQEAENVVGMFGLHYDVVGFGSGAISILDGNYCAHTSGLLHSYIEDPLRYDLKVPIVSSNSALFTLLRSGLSIYDGIQLSLWQERLKQSIHESLENPDIKNIIDLFKKVGNLTIDQEKIFLPKENAPMVLIGVVNGSMI